MAEVKSLLEKLKTESDEELDMFSGKKPRQFFIEVLPADSVDKLMEEYKPDEHNSEWDSERQKDAPDPQKLIIQRQAIAFMNSGRNGMFRRYRENELRAYVHGRSYTIRNHYFLELTKKLVEMEKVYEQ